MSSRFIYIYPEDDLTGGCFIIRCQRPFTIVQHNTYNMTHEHVSLQDFQQRLTACTLCRCCIYAHALASNHRLTVLDLINDSVALQLLICGRQPVSHFIELTEMGTCVEAARSYFCGLGNAWFQSKEWNVNARLVLSKQACGSSNRTRSSQLVTMA